MKKMIFIATVMLVSCSEQTKSEQKEAVFNLEAAESYFNIADKLISGGKVTSDTWQAFFNIEGNRLYLKENGVEDRKEAMQKSMEIVYASQSDSIVEALEKSNPYIVYQKRYKSHYTKIKSFLKTLNNDPKAYQQEMLALTRKYLPKRMHTLDNFPKIYFHALGEPSANPSGMFFDLMVDYDCNQELYASMAAHELHHQMRHSILENIEINADDKGLVWVLDAILNEGLADLVDKESLLSEKSNWWMKELFKPIINSSPTAIETLDGLILNESRGKHTSENEYRKALMNSVGHIPGYFMAQKIKENEKLTELIEHADNPFIFIILYDKVTKFSSENLPKFSKETIEHIEKMNERYNN